MDRRTPSTVEHSAAVRTAGLAALDVLLPAAAGERTEPASAAPAGRAVPGDPVLRQPQNGRSARLQPQTHAAADAHSRDRSSLSQTALEPPRARPRGVPVLAARSDDRAAQPSLEHRYYLRSDAWRLSVSGRRDGLVQPLRAQLGVVQHYGDGFLPG